LSVNVNAKTAENRILKRAVEDGSLPILFWSLGAKSAMIRMNKP